MTSLPPADVWFLNLETGEDVSTTYGEASNVFSVLEVLVSSNPALLMHLMNSSILLLLNSSSEIWIGSL